MPNSALLFGIFIASVAWPGLAVSQTSSGQKIPDFSGGWARIGEFVEMFEAIPGHEGAGPMLVDPRYPHIQGGGGTETGLQWIADLDNPILKPETLAKLQLNTEA